MDKGKRRGGLEQSRLSRKGREDGGLVQRKKETGSGPNWDVVWVSFGLDRKRKWTFLNKKRKIKWTYPF